MYRPLLYHIDSLEKRIQPGNYGVWGSPCQVGGGRKERQSHRGFMQWTWLPEDPIESTRFRVGFLAFYTKENTHPLVE